MPCIPDDLRLAALILRAHAIFAAIDRLRGDPAAIARLPALSEEMGAAATELGLAIRQRQRGGTQGGA